MPSDWTGSISDSRLEGDDCTVAYYEISEVDGGSWSTLTFHFGTAENLRGILLPAAVGEWRRLRSRPCDQHHSRQRCMRLPVHTCALGQGAANRTRGTPVLALFLLVLSTSLGLRFCLDGARKEHNFFYFCPVDDFAVVAAY